LTDPSQLISHGIPNRSITMPNRSAQNVFSSGITMLPAWLSSRKIRWASVASLIWIDSEKPFGAS
jgi:hypothetical protein